MDLNLVCEGINIYGTIINNKIEKNVVCTVTYEFLEDINQGNTNHENTLQNNLLGIEFLAETKLDALSRIQLEKSNCIEIKINAEDAKKFNR